MAAACYFYRKRRVEQMQISTIKILSQIPLFSALTEAHLIPIAKQTRVLELARNEMLFQKGDAAEGFYYVISGQIKLALLSAQGDEKVMELLRPGMSFGEAVMLIGESFPAYAQALEKSQLMFVAREAVMIGIDNSPELAKRMLAGLSRRLHRVVSDLEEISLHNATQRVIGHLLGEAVATDGNTTQCTLSAQKSIIASRLNLTPETFSRVLQQLQQANIIAVSGREITINDLQRLGEYRSGD
jgi:CRP-like cAMP-binding protein